MKVKPGQTVVVTTISGSRITGRVEALSGGALDLQVTRGDIGRRVTITPASAQEIKRKGPIWDGAVKAGLIGLGIAALIGSNFGYVRRGGNNGTLDGSGYWPGCGRLVRSGQDLSRTADNVRVDCADRQPRHVRCPPGSYDLAGSARWRA